MRQSWVVLDLMSTLLHRKISEGRRGTLDYKEAYVQHILEDNWQGNGTQMSSLLMVVEVPCSHMNQVQ